MTSCSVSSLPLSLSRQREEEGAEESESAAETEGPPAAVGAGRSLPSSSNRANLRPNSSSHRRLQLLLPLHVWALFLLLLCPLFFLLLANSTTLAVPGLSVLRMSSNGQQAQQQLPLRVMTFNIWVSGANVHNGMDKIASQILDVDPDIVALQEVRTAEVATNLTQLLGPSKWKSAHHPFAAYPDTAILTKHKFVLEKEFVHLQFERNISDFLFNEEHYMNNSVITYGMIRATIELEPSGQLVNFVSLHLDWRAYGPYAANNKLVTSQKQIMAGERNKQGYGRAQNIEQMLADEGFQRYLHVADQQPLIVAGDFNAPSHLDWTEETKDIHGGWAFEWPSSKLLADAGFHDSFRNIHPDIKKEPGITWSTVQKSVGPDWDWTVPEPQDRIDLILYKPSAKFRPLHSYTYAGKGPLKPIPEQFDNEWPSDHYAVVTDFAVDEPAAVNGEQKLVN